MFDGEAFGKAMVEIVREHVTRATAPLSERIAELEAREIPEAIRGERGEKGERGESADMEQVERWVSEGIAAAVQAIPAPKDGNNGADGQDGRDGTDGKDGKDGADGVGLADALIDKDGSLVLTMTDGRTKSLGRVVGIDGQNGADGEAFTLDDFDIEPLDERSIQLRFAKNGVTHSFDLEFPVPIYRGVYQTDGAYERGDMVTWGGSLWHADEKTAEKPDIGPWRLVAKKGRDGRSAQ